MLVNSYAWSLEVELISTGEVFYFSQFVFSFLPEVCLFMGVHLYCGSEVYAFGKTVKLHNYLIT